MRFATDVKGLDEATNLFNWMPQLAQRNAVNACVAMAHDARNLLRDATKGPKSGKIAGGELGEVAEAWTVIPEPTGASVINTDPIAGYLEFGVGIYNEGPGLKGPIVPRKGKALRFEIDGKVVFARSVKGFKGVAMVRGNWENLKRLARQHAEDAAKFTSEGRTYG